MKKPIFRRYEIRPRNNKTGEDMENTIRYRFFTLNAAVRDCRFLNVQRRLLGALSFEYYITDRRFDV